LPQLARSRQEALEVHRLALAGRLATCVVTVEDAWAEVTCERAVSGIRAGVSTAPVADLYAHDKEHGSAYAATLAAWLDHPGDPQSAAKRVHVHPNTLRYRMQKLPEFVDLDLTKPVTRLAARIELRALGL
jgi:sugar diacid utilization regulator